jgi:hypothetical protein
MVSNNVFFSYTIMAYGLSYIVYHTVYTSKVGAKITCITIIDTIIHFILTNYTNNAYISYILYLRWGQSWSPSARRWTTARRCCVCTRWRREHCCRCSRPSRPVRLPLGLVGPRVPWDPVTTVVVAVAAAAAVVVVAVAVAVAVAVVVVVVRVHRPTHWWQTVLGR